MDNYGTRTHTHIGEPKTDGRQNCGLCLRTVGTMPNGERRTYYTETAIFGDESFRRWHYCYPHCP